MDTMTASESEQKFSGFDSDLYTTTDVEVGDTEITPKPIKKKTLTTSVTSNKQENAFPLSEPNSNSDTEIKECSSPKYQIEDSNQKEKVGKVSYKKLRKHVM